MVTTGIAQYPFVGDSSKGQLSFPYGATLQVVQPLLNKNGWVSGWYDGQKGWFPVSFVSIQQQQEQQQRVYPQQIRVPQQQPGVVVDDDETSALTLPTTFQSKVHIPQHEDDDMTTASTISFSGFDLNRVEIMGGKGNNVATSLPTMNHSPWQTNRQVQDSLAGFKSEIHSDSNANKKKKKKRESSKTKPSPATSTNNAQKRKTQKSKKATVAPVSIPENKFPTDATIVLKKKKKRPSKQGKNDSTVVAMKEESMARKKEKQKVTRPSVTGASCKEVIATKPKKKAVKLATNKSRKKSLPAFEANEGTILQEEEEPTGTTEEQLGTAYSSIRSTNHVMETSDAVSAIKSLLVTSDTESHKYKDGQKSHSKNERKKKVKENSEPIEQTIIQMTGKKTMPMGSLQAPTTIVQKEISTLPVVETVSDEDSDSEESQGVLNVDENHDDAITLFPNYVDAGAFAYTEASSKPAGPAPKIPQTVARSNGDKESNAVSSRTITTGDCGARAVSPATDMTRNTLIGKRAPNSVSSLQQNNTLEECTDPNEPMVMTSQPCKARCGFNGSFATDWYCAGCYSAVMTATRSAALGNTNVKSHIDTRPSTFVGQGLRPNGSAPQGMSSPMVAHQVATNGHMNMQQMMNVPTMTMMGAQGAISGVPVVSPLSQPQQVPSMVLTGSSPTHTMDPNLNLSKQIATTAYKMVGTAAPSKTTGTFPCKMECGFYGSPKTEGYCNKCYCSITSRQEAGQRTIEPTDFMGAVSMTRSKGQLCKMQCGFYGSFQTDGYCTSCYRNHKESAFKKATKDNSSPLDRTSPSLSSATAKRCKMECGFFGSAATNGYCSNCWRKIHR